MSTSAYSSLSLDGRVAVVTGAASGIGRATAVLLASRGATTVFADLDLEGAEAGAAHARAQGGDVRALETDVTDEASVADLVVRTTAELGRIDVLHNNAALMTAHARDDLVADLDPSDFARTLQVNLIGYMICAKHVIPTMVSRGGGVIVNTASLAGSQASLTRPMYGASKAGVVGLTRSIATQYGKQGIRSVSISPGMIVTDRSSGRLPEHTLAAVRRHNLLDRTGTPDDVAQLVAFVASDAASFLTGLDIPLDGGMSAHLASFADELASRTSSAPADASSA